MATVLITGGTGDIGRAIAQALAARGDTPVIAGRDLVRAREVADAIDGASAVALDITDATDCQRAVATVVGHHGRVDTVSPGIIDYEMSAEALGTPHIREMFMAHTPLGRPGRTDEVAATVAFLLSDAASFVTASLVPTDGGFLSR